jgi:hypothetical protein
VTVIEEVNYVIIIIIIIIIIIFVPPGFMQYTSLTLILLSVS